MGRFFVGALAGLLVLLALLVGLVIYAQQPSSPTLREAVESHHGKRGRDERFSASKPMKIADTKEISPPKCFDISAGSRASFDFVVDYPRNVAYRLSRAAGSESVPLTLAYDVNGVIAFRSITAERQWLNLGVPQPPAWDGSPFTVKAHLSCSADFVIPSQACKVCLAANAEFVGGGPPTKRSSKMNKAFVAGPTATTPMTSAPIGSWTWFSLIPMGPYIDLHEWYFGGPGSTPLPWNPDPCNDLSDDNIAAKCFQPGLCNAGGTASVSEFLYRSSEATAAIVYPALLPVTQDNWPPFYDTNPAPSNVIDQITNLPAWEDGWWSCTAWLVGPETILLTAQHCIRGRPEVAAEMEFYFDAQSECPNDPSICDYTADFSMYKCALCDINEPYNVAVNTNSYFHNGMTHYNWTGNEGACVLASDFQLDYDLLQMRNPTQQLRDRLLAPYLSPGSSEYLKPLQMVPSNYRVRAGTEVFMAHHTLANGKRIASFDNYQTPGHQGGRGLARIRNTKINLQQWGSVPYAAPPTCCPSLWWDLSTWNFPSDFTGYKYAFTADIDADGGASGSGLVIDPRRPKFWKWTLLFERDTEKGQKFWNLATAEEQAGILAMPADMVEEYRKSYENFKEEQSNPNSLVEKTLPTISKDDLQLAQMYDEDVDPSVSDFMNQLVDLPSAERMYTFNTFDGESQKNVAAYMERFGADYMDSEKFQASDSYTASLDAFELDRLKKFGPYVSYAGRAVGLISRWNDEFYYTWDTAYGGSGEECAEHGKMEFIPIAHILGNIQSKIKKQQTKANIKLWNGYITTTSWSLKLPKMNIVCPSSTTGTATLGKPSLKTVAA